MYAVPHTGLPVLHGGACWLKLSCIAPIPQEVILQSLHTHLLMYPVSPQHDSLEQGLDVRQTQGEDSALSLASTGTLSKSLTLSNTQFCHL